MNPIRTWQKRRVCFHHDHIAGRSWITGRLIDTGARKVFTCSECGRMWFT